MTDKTQLWITILGLVGVAALAWAMARFRWAPPRGGHLTA